MNKLKDNKTLRFFISYIILMVAALFIIGYEPIKRLLDINGFYTNFVVAVTAFSLKMLNIDVIQQGMLLIFPGKITLRVLFGCNGLEAFIIYGAAVVAFPASLKQKLFGVFIGFVVIQVLNIIRILLLGIIGVYYPSFFHYFHIYVAQGAMIAVALFLFIGWLNFVQIKR